MVGQSFFHLSRRTTMIQDLLVRRQFSLVPDNRTSVNVKACTEINDNMFVSLLLLGNKYYSVKIHKSWIKVTSAVMCYFVTYLPNSQ
jgi:hypothetical protein